LRTLFNILTGKRQEREAVLTQAASPLYGVCFFEGDVSSITKIQLKLIVPFPPGGESNLLQLEKIAMPSIL
jgi:hypothetical protein